MNISEPPERIRPPRSAAPAPVPPEEAGTQALSEALQSSFRIVKWLMLGLVVLFFLTGMFTVGSNQVGVILRFGKPVGTALKPGWHWSFPQPIDQVVLIPVGQTHTLRSTIGWYATTPELEATGKEPPARPSLSPGVDGYTLTGDGNTIHVRATLKYRIRSAAALDHHFNFVSATNLLQHLLDNALLYASSRSAADAALYRDSAGFKELVFQRVSQKVEELQLGVELEPSEIQISAPLDVRPAFDAVVAAAQDRSRKISEAQGYAEQRTRKAQGEAAALLSAGITHSNQLVQAVAAEAGAFNAQLPFYRNDPQLFQHRLLSETMGRVLTNAQDKFFVPARADGQARELRIQLNREPQKPASAPKNDR